VAKIVEPPILMSRILMFVLATSVVVLGTLVFVLIKMIPLERPEVFFVANATRSVNVIIEPFEPNSANEKAISYYERGFIQEYVIARNTLSDNISMTRNNWKEIVKNWSSDNVYTAFTKTKMYRNYAFGGHIPNAVCDVYFSDPKNKMAIIKTGKGDYTVSFTWICKNIGGQTTSKNYKIKIKIKSDLEKRMSGTLENLQKLKANPLGIQVVEYKTDEDPLNNDVTSL